MGFLAPLLQIGARAGNVLLINFSLFLIIPVSQELFSSFGDKKEKEEQVTHRVVAEMVQKPKPKKKTVQKNRIRSVNSSSGKSLQNPMKFKLSPDLSVAGAGNGASIATGQMQAQVFEEGSVEQPAIPQSIPPFKYPEEARKLAVSGEGIITFIVGTEGRVVDIVDIDVPHNSLEKAVRTWLPSLKFTPAQNQGVPVAQKMMLPMDFQLD